MRKSLAVIPILLILTMLFAVPFANAITVTVATLDYPTDFGFDYTWFHVYNFSFAVSNANVTVDLSNAQFEVGGGIEIAYWYNGTEAESLQIFEAEININVTHQNIVIDDRINFVEDYFGNLFATNATEVTFQFNATDYTFNIYTDVEAFTLSYDATSDYAQFDAIVISVCPTEYGIIGDTTAFATITSEMTSTEYTSYTLWALLPALAVVILIGKMFRRR